MGRQTPTFPPPPFQHPRPARVAEEPAPSLPSSAQGLAADPGARGSRVQNAVDKPLGPHLPSQNSACAPKSEPRVTLGNLQHSRFRPSLHPQRRALPSHRGSPLPCSSSPRDQYSKVATGRLLHQRKSTERMLNWGFYWS